MVKIVFTEPAEHDLLDIEYYIYKNLCNPQASKRITDGIWIGTICLKTRKQGAVVDMMLPNFLNVK